MCIRDSFRAFNGGKNDANYYLNFTVGGDDIDSFEGANSNTYGKVLDEFYSTGLIGQALINSPGTKATGFGSLTGTDALRVNVELNSIDGTAFGDELAAGTSYPLTMDFVTFGQSNDGVAASDRHNNGIWRVEVDEVDTNGGIFVGELDFIMLNQINVNQTSTYLSLIHI